MKELIFFMLLYLVVPPLVFLLLFRYFRKKHLANGSVINYNPTMSRFVYLIEMSPEEALAALEVKNVADKICCDVDRENALLVFSEGLLEFKVRYYYSFKACDGGFLLLLERKIDIIRQTRMCYKFNSFMRSKLNAKPVPISQYTE